VISEFPDMRTYEKWLKLPPEDERYYSFLPEIFAKHFHKRYKEKPHLYRRDEKDAEDKWYGDDFITQKAHEYFLSRFPYHDFMIERMKYKKDHVFTFLEEWKDFIVLQEWHNHSSDPCQKEYWHMIRVMFIHKDNNEEYSYTYAPFKNIYMMLPAMEVKYMGRYQTGYDCFYSHEQRIQHPDTIKILKKVDRLKYVPVEDFERINYFKLLNSSDLKLYSCELMLKLGGKKAASEVLLYDVNIGKQSFKKYAQVFEKNRSLRNYIERQHLSAEKLKHDELNERLKKMKPLKFVYKNLLIMTPKDFMDMKFESDKLNHCVGTNDRYLKKIVAGTSMIFFLRKNDSPEDPFMTIEVNDHEVIQVRGHTNATDEEYTNIVNEWFSKNKKNLPICQV
jgi:hypothetical protein